MVNEELEKSFRKAVAIVNGYNNPFPADLLLKLYAYYRVANQDYSHPGSRTPLINAFKANALIQARNVTPDEAKRAYIDLVNSEINKL
jgi:diazepam-binding inhibitor (GABA receptor modulator, acyl-CoA-binding protein)